MVVLLFHGATGGWDELAIALVAIVVLWGAVKLAGRKPANDDDEDDARPDAARAPDREPVQENKEHRDPAHSSTKVS